MTDFDLITSKGERTVNEDSVRIIEKNDFTVFVLADGLGGQGFGDVASNAAVEAVKEYALNNDFDDDFIKNCFICANEGVLNAQREKDYYDMRTTLVVLVVANEKAYWGHIGDSRLYVFKNCRCEKRTADHSVVQTLLNMGEIKDEDIRHHADRNKLLRALGTDDGDSVKFDICNEPVDISARDFLLCSDGFWEWIIESEMEKLLKKEKDAHICLKNMSNIALVNGFKNNMDNLSAILVRCR